MITYTIVGRLIRDAESVSDKNGNSSEKFTLAVNTNKENSRLYTCYFHGERAKKLHPYLLKGRQLMIIGTPSWREYNGSEYESVMVSILEFCGSKSDIEKQNPDNKPYEMDGRYFDTREELNSYKASRSSDGLNGPEVFDAGDDIPF